MKNGFSLIELSIVIAIIGIVVAAAVGAWGEGRAKREREVEKHPRVAEYPLPYGQVAREFKLSDGTRCVTYRESIACEWQR